MPTIYDIAIAHYRPFGPKTMERLLLLLPDVESIWKAERSELLHPEIPEEKIDEFLAWRATQSAERLVENIERLKIQTVGIDDAEYPPLLKALYDPPRLLFMVGTWPPPYPALAVVGSRSATSYGRQMAHDLTYQLARAGLTIVSGGAQGVDEIAHRAALEAKTKTVAVLGCGIRDNDMKDKQTLLDKIIDEGGAVITEFPPGTPPFRSNFPQRNRIIAGMSQGTLVVEAAEGSGSLITARAAIHENREVFAVPGPINSIYSWGTNDLCKTGAHLVTCARDILEILGRPTLAETSPNPSFVRRGSSVIIPAYLSDDARRVLELLTVFPTHIDELTRRASLPSSAVSIALSTLEIDGLVKHEGGMMYVLT